MSIFKKNYSKSILDCKELWVDYGKRMYEQAEYLNWEMIWLNEHSQRAILLQSFIDSKNKEKKIFIEVPVENKRADLIICSKGKDENVVIDEIVEIKKNQYRCWKININDDKAKTLSKIKIAFDGALKKINEGKRNKKSIDQLKAYKKLFEGRSWGYEVKNIAVLQFTQVLFRLDTNDPKKINVDKLMEVYLDLFTEKHFKDLLKSYENLGFYWVSVPEEKLRNYKLDEDIIKKYKTPYFRAPYNKNRDETIKIFGGIIVTWENIPD